MDDEKLIVPVKARSFIYTKSDKNHSNRDILSAAWENIAREVGDNGDVPFWFSSRMFTTLMCFIAVLIMYLLRFNMSVGVVCMVNDTADASSLPHKAIIDRNSVNETKNSTAEESLYLTPWRNDSELKGRSNYPHDKKLTIICGRAKNNSENEETKDGPFLWTKQEQGLILSTYYWSYVICAIPCGGLANRYNNVRILGMVIAFSSTMCLLTPLVAYISPIAVMIVRALMGSVAGFYLPCAQNLLNKWIPPAEVAGLTSFVFSGIAVGNLVSFFSSGFLCEYGFADGWQSIFYTHVWMLLVNKGPNFHPRISVREREYIIAKMKKNKKNNKSKKVPWKELLTSKPVFAIAASTVSADYCSIAFTVFIPMYFTDVLNFKITSTSIFTALLAIVQFFMQTAGGAVSDLILKKTTFTVTTVRKLIIGSGKIICLLSFIALGFATCETANLAVVLMMVIAASTGFMSLGYAVNPIDVGAHLSGLILSIVTLCGNLFSLASLALTTALIAEDSARESWQILFSACGGVVGVALVIYLCFASGEVQPWAIVQEDKCTEDENALNERKRIEGSDLKDFVGTETS